MGLQNSLNSNNNSDYKYLNTTSGYFEMTACLNIDKQKKFL